MTLFYFLSFFYSNFSLSFLFIHFLFYLGLPLTFSSFLYPPRLLCSLSFIPFSRFTSPYLSSFPYLLTYLLFFFPLFTLLPLPLFLPFLTFLLVYKFHTEGRCRAVSVQYPGGMLGKFVCCVRAVSVQYPEARNDILLCSILLRV